MYRLLLLFLPLLVFCNDAPTHILTALAIDVNNTIDLSDKGIEALKFCQDNKMNTDYCVLIDMRIHSGKNRFFVYEFKTDSILDKGLVSHGCGDSAWAMDCTKENPVFSNTQESHKSSLGKYKIGKRGYSNWGIHVNYKLHGLEKTNSNAYKRYIVLHSWNMIDEKECFPMGTPEGWGCPAVNDEFMKRLDSRLQKANKPVLLWIYQ